MPLDACLRTCTRRPHSPPACPGPEGMHHGPARDPAAPEPAATAEYLTDAWQRSVLFLDVMRRRAAQYEAHAAELAPNVLDYKAELVLDGRTLARPVNYLLARIVPPEGVDDRPEEAPLRGRRPARRPRPRHRRLQGRQRDRRGDEGRPPGYFIGFLPDPEPGQTIEDIAVAEAAFLEAVIARHPEAEGKPCVIGNCQAGWAVMILAALRPELFGPIIIAGSPLSYWAGVHGQYPMRYSGGLLGGKLADGADRRPRRRHLRRRVAGAELREPEPRQHALEQAVQPLVQDRHRGRALSRLREVVGRARHPERRGDAVHRR